MASELDFVQFYYSVRCHEGWFFGVKAMLTEPKPGGFSTSPPQTDLEETAQWH
jgi:hypothetical protein